MIVLFFFNDTATTEIYTLSLHDALPISDVVGAAATVRTNVSGAARSAISRVIRSASETTRSEEHTSELQSRQYLVCRLLLEKKTDMLLTVHFLITLSFPILASSVYHTST